VEDAKAHHHKGQVMSTRLQIGQTAPPIKLYDTRRKQVTLRDFQGKTVVLAFFPGAFTDVCKREMCSFRDSLANFEAVNAQVVGISVNDPFTLAAFAEQNRLLFPLLSDYDRVAIRAYDIVHQDFAGLKGYVAAKRSVFIVSGDGYLRWKWVSDNPLVEPPYSDIQHAIDDLKRRGAPR
jgi:peroxiredoxin